MKRFWDKVEKTDGCWNWTAGKTGGRGGEYGAIRLSRPRRQVYAHRLSFAMAAGIEYDDLRRLHVMHICDNPKCVRPDHLMVGTHTDNVRDMHRKSRHNRGGSKLTDSDVREVRRRYAAGELQREIAADFNIGRSTVSLIVNRKNWKAI